MKIKRKSRLRGLDSGSAYIGIGHFYPGRHVSRLQSNKIIFMIDIRQKSYEF